MQCGFAEGGCDDCPTVSIQSVSLYSVAQEPAWLVPSRWVCGRDWGMLLPGAEDPLSSPDFDCWAAPLPEPPTQQKPPRKRPPPPADADEDILSREAQNDSNRLASICEIDPAACTKPECTGDCVTAKWTMWRPAICGQYPAQEPRLLEVGKSRPLDEWTFPFRSAADGIECVGERYLRRVRPSLVEPTNPGGR